MKRKFLILTLCFTIVFSSLNYKKSYADGGTISLPILATVSALAVGTGIVISGNDDLFDIGRIFYDYIDGHNDLTWATVQSVFSASVSLQANKLVSVKSDFLDIVKGFFDSKLSNLNDTVTCFGSTAGLPYYGSYVYDNNGVLGYYSNISDILNGGGVSVGDFYFSLKNPNYNNSYILNYYSPYSTNAVSITLSHNDVDLSNMYFYVVDGGTASYPFELRYSTIVDGVYKSGRIFKFASAPSVSIPYTGGYVWDNVESKKENESIALPIPGDLGSLVGQGSTDFWDNTDNLVGSGDISIPNVENPSIILDNTTSFPDTNVDTNNPTIDGILPSFPSFGDSLDFSPMYLTNVTEKFPFSLPWDIGRLLQQFDVEPVAPVFEVPIVSETITLDLTEFSELASIVRFFVLIGFILALIFISTRLMA